MSPSLNPERWARQREIFAAAIERGAGAQEFAREQCGGDEEMYSGVRRMIEADRRSGILDQRPKLSEAQPEQPSPPVFADGQIAGRRYRIARYLGRGGMGEVYEAEDLDIPEMKEHVALKTLLPAIASDQSMLARFRQEITLSRRIQHPNVCSAFDLSKHETEGAEAVWFLTMPFLPGQTLAARLGARSPMKPEEALPLLEQMAAALDAAHRAGVIHRDFKPSNVMLTPSPNGECAVVTDFGLARRMPTVDDSTSTLSGQLMGTLDYMSPELLTGATATFRSDIYALGMTAYRMVAGALPFADQTPLAAAILRAKQSVPSPKTIAPSLMPQWDLAIQRVLDRDPSRRFSSAGHFVQALRGEPVSVTVKLPVLTRRKVIAGSAVALAAAGGGVAWSAWLKERSRPPAEAEALYRTGVDDIHAGAYFAATKALEKAVEIAPQYAMAHARLADAWMGLEMPQKAREEMLLARRQDLSTLTADERLELEAIDLTTTREFTAAVRKFEEARKILRPKSDLYVDIGRSYENAGERDKGIAAYLHLARGGSPNPAASLRLGVLYSRAGNLGSADALFKLAEDLYQRTSNLEGLIEVAQQRGVAANEQMHLQEGEAFLRKAFQTAHFAGNIQQEIRAQLNLSTNAYAAGATKIAEKYASDALQLARANRVEALAIRGIIALGSAHQRKGDLAGSERYYQEALTFSRGADAPHLTARSLLALASLHDSRRQFDQATKEAREALAYYQPNRFTQETFSCLTIMGRSLRNGGEYDAACNAFKSLLVLAEQSQDKFQMSVAHESLGSVAFRQENYPDALAEYQKGLELSSTEERTGYARLQCALTMSRLGRFADAEHMLEMVTATAKKFQALRLDLLQTEAELNLAQHRYAAGVRNVRQALDSGGDQNPPSLAELKRLRGLAELGLGNRIAALRDCKDALVLAADSDVTSLLRARIAVMQAFLENNDRLAATKVFHEIEPLVESYPESRWRALALASRLDRIYGFPARQALDSLARSWGDRDFQSYTSRPDIQQFVTALPMAVSRVSH